FVCPALWFEEERLIIEARISLGRPLKHEYLHSGAYLITANLAVLDRFAPKSVRRRIKTHRLFGDLLGQFQTRQVRKCRFAFAEYLVQLRMKFRFHFGMRSQ